MSGTPIPSRGPWFLGVAKVVPGVVAIAVVAGAASLLGRFVPVIGGSVLGLLIGVIFGSPVETPQMIRLGMDYTLKRLLRLAIILFGASLGLVDVIRIGGGSLAVILLTIALAISCTYMFGCGYERRQGLLASLE